MTINYYSNVQKKKQNKKAKRTTKIVDGMLHNDNLESIDLKINNPKLYNDIREILDILKERNTKGVVVGNADVVVVADAAAVANAAAVCANTGADAATPEVAVCVVAAHAAAVAHGPSQVFVAAAYAAAEPGEQDALLDHRQQACY